MLADGLAQALGETAAAWDFVFARCPRIAESLILFEVPKDAQSRNPITTNTSMHVTLLRGRDLRRRLGDLVAGLV